MARLIIVHHVFQIVFHEFLLVGIVAFLNTSMAMANNSDKSKVRSKNWDKSLAHCINFASKYVVVKNILKVVCFFLVNAPYSKFYRVVGYYYYDVSSVGLWTVLNSFAKVLARVSLAVSP